MRRYLILSALVFAACGTTPSQDCKSMNAATCKRAFQCLTAQEAQAANYGASEAECIAKLDEQCAAFDEIQLCSPGMMWHSDRARACANYVEKLSCAEVRDGGLTGSGSPDCSKVCS